jgi:hypothetical protein
MTDERAKKSCACHRNHTAGTANKQGATLIVIGDTYFKIIAVIFFDQG